ncbi:hypothetical protein BKA62DRAFT_504319 [Auriculariales sp. MPI-PUGE-AT-0066]|nr:hypothetical protein BKA62DRAFT_504319 [Auriculariales sp. MPI-PUGE-AT-0066]
MASHPPAPDWASDLENDDSVRRLADIQGILHPEFWNPPDPVTFCLVWTRAVRGHVERYKVPDYMIPWTDNHPEWPTFQESMCSLRAAKSFDRIAAIIEDWNTRFPSDDMHSVGSSMQPEGIALQTSRNLPQSPIPYEFVEFKAVESAVNAVLDQFIKQALDVDGLLHTDTLERVFPLKMMWKVPEKWKQELPDIYNNLKNKNIPARPFGEPEANVNPDLLLYGLGSFYEVDPDFEQRLRECEGHDTEYIHIADAAGSGKTRFILEYLARISSGLYFTFQADKTTNPYGSRDLECAIELMADPAFRADNQESFVTIVEEQRDNDEDAVKRQKRWNFDWANNKKIAAHAFTNLLLSRILVYEAFCRAITRGGIPARSPAVRRAWCLLQVAPHLIGGDDIFLSIFQQVQLLSRSSAEARLKQVTRHLVSEGFYPLNTVAIDEAQLGTRRHTTCFGPDEKKSLKNDQGQAFKQMRRPVLKPLVKILNLLHTVKRIIVSGTKINRMDIEEALGSALGKHKKVDEPIPVFGENDRRERIFRTLDIFTCKGFSYSLSEETQNDIIFYLQGRHRFLSLFIGALLREGPSEVNARDILYHIVSALSGHYVSRHDAPSFDYIAVDGLLHGIITAPETDQNREQIHNLETVLVNFLITRRYSQRKRSGTDLSLIDPGLEELVELGIGRLARPPLKSESTDGTVLVVFNENLILIALWHWFTKKTPGHKSRLQRYLQRTWRSAEPSSAGLGWEDVVAYMLWHWFVGQKGHEAPNLSKVFHFCGLRPAWASDQISLVQTLLINAKAHTVTASGNTEVVVADAKVHSVKAVLAAQGTTLGLSYQTRSMEETVRALLPYRLEEQTASIFQQRGYAFIKPDNTMGPDILAIGRLPDGTLILIVVQCKDKKDRIAHSEMLKIVEDLSPEHGWWTDKDGNLLSSECKKHIDTICELFPVPDTAYEFTDAEIPSEYGTRSNSRDRPKLKCALLRVIALPKVTELDPHAHHGPYPIALFSPEAIECTIDEFDTMKDSLRKAQADQDETLKNILHSQPAPASPTPVTTRTNIPQESYNAKYLHGIKRLAEGPVPLDLGDDTTRRPPKRARMSINQQFDGLSTEQSDDP